VKTTDPSAKIHFYQFPKNQVTYTVPGLDPNTVYKVASSYINTIEKESPFSDETNVQTSKLPMPDEA
jgi:tRNA(Ile2) C34 agmatinyltransferase TiaS